MAEADVKQLKIRRRNAKSTLTRQGKALQNVIDAKRTVPEVRDCLEKFKGSYNDLIGKHEELMQCIEDDEEFAEHELWVDECQDQFMRLDVQMYFAAKDYIQNVDKIVQNESNDAKPNHHDSTEENEVEHVNVEQNAAGQNKHEVSNNDNNEAIVDPPNGNDKELKNDNNACGFKVEKPKMPKFSGDVRDYHAIFLSDFQHIAGSSFSKRDSITLLRASLQGKPLEFIKGIGSDYDAAWDYLNSIYGDPRFVADTVTHDLSKFRPLRNDEDTRFCDLVHLISRSYNTLKEVGRPHDMDNNHMLALIEQKLCSDDRKVWSRHLEGQQKSATLESLIEWMTTEMKSRMRASAPVRASSQPLKPVVGTVFSTPNNAYKPFLSYKCWLCKSSDHWLDQCQRFLAMRPEERLTAVKENHTCFSCLKRAGRNHKASTCTRKRQCSEKVDGDQCKQYHHRPIHQAIQSTNKPVVTSISTKTEAMLPIVQADLLGPSDEEIFS